MRFPSYTKEILVAAFLTALIGEIYFYPFGTAFRFTAGVVVISFLALYFPKIPQLALFSFTGATVLGFRFLLTFFSRDVNWQAALCQHYPAFFFYLAYGFFLYLGRIRELLTSPVHFIALMTLADFGANLVELAVRQELSPVWLQRIVGMLVGIAFLRSLVTFFLYWLLERYKLFVLAEEHEKRYAELLELLSELKAELTFLKKSTNDLEKAMSASYEIYQKLGPDLAEEEIRQLKKKALDLARQVHEIKKDYLKISAGFSQLLPEEDKQGMRMSSVFLLLNKNLERWLRAEDKKVEFHSFLEKDFNITNYFTFFSILSNLVSNALDAVGPEGGRIELAVRFAGENAIKLSVADNGCGIKKEDLPFIFAPGFSTKVREDGAVSTGLGLTHVQNLVEEMNGEIQVFSGQGGGSRFEITIPFDRCCQLLPEGE